MSPTLYDMNGYVRLNLPIFHEILVKKANFDEFRLVKPFISSTVRYLWRLNSTFEIKKVQGIYNCESFVKIEIKMKNVTIFFFIWEPSSVKRVPVSSPHARPLLTINPTGDQNVPVIPVQSHSIHFDSVLCSCSQ